MIRIAIALFVLLSLLATGNTPLSAEDVITRSRAVYAALKSYSDTGTVVFESGPAASLAADRHAVSRLVLRRRTEGERRRRR